jgi:ABC-2 type transport system ATP-binding protein
MCTRVAVIDRGRVLAAGTLDDLREDSGEDLEDIFIRLVGASVDDIEAKISSDEEE